MHINGPSHGLAFVGSAVNMLINLLNATQAGRDHVSRSRRLFIGGAQNGIRVCTAELAWWLGGSGGGSVRCRPYPPD